MKRTGPGRGAASAQRCRHLFHPSVGGGEGRATGTGRGRHRLRRAGRCAVSGPEQSSGTRRATAFRCLVVGTMVRRTCSRCGRRVLEFSNGRGEVEQEHRHGGDSVTAVAGREPRLRPVGAVLTVQVLKGRRAERAGEVGATELAVLSQEPHSQVGQCGEVVDRRGSDQRIRLGRDLLGRR